MPLPTTQNVPGVYHRVEKGQSLWRISKTYGVDMEEIIDINRLPDATKLNEGQLLFIPGAEDNIKIEIAPLRKTESADFENIQIPDSGDFIWPVKGRVTSFYGAKKGNIKNKGIDIQAEEGTDVLASRSGVVSYCDENLKGYGKTVIIDHRDGFSSVYAHNSEILVEPGSKVKRGERIAKVGSTGRAQSPYLHFEIRKKHLTQNPFYYLP